jgi:hypothetical protein
MLLRTLIRDCLYLNWALPVSSLPELPEPLRYESHPFQEEPHAFASALLFRNERLHLAAMPFLRLTYPQFNLRLYVLDGEGVCCPAPGTSPVSPCPPGSSPIHTPRKIPAPSPGGGRCAGAGV